jgi:hypothetical protein
MPKLIDNDNDDATVPETAYQGEEKAVSGKGTSRSAWGLVIVALFLAALAVFAFSRGASHTDPAPNGGSASTGAGTAPSPAQNSP